MSTSNVATALRWKDFFRIPGNRGYFWFVMALFAVMFFTVFFTLAYVEQRPGEVIETWARDIFGSPLDFSIGIFTITYFSMIYAIAEHAMRPVTFLRMFTAYAFMQIGKCMLLLAIPLDAPSDILPLSDPVLETLFYGGNVNLKDLFFSGHVATVFIAGYFTKRKSMKWIFLVLGILLSFMLAQQRVHYVIDVVAAPLFAWLACWLSSFTTRSSSGSGF